MDRSGHNGQDCGAGGARPSVSFGIAEVGTPAHGWIGFTAALGIRGGAYLPELLDRDLEALVEWGATAMLCLMEQGEVEGLTFERLSYGLRDRGIGFLHLPIPPRDVPDARFDRDWERLRPRLLGALGHRQRLMVQCMDGRRRSGIAVARLLIDTGCEADEAIAALRGARPEALPADREIESVRAYACER